MNLLVNLPPDFFTQPELEDRFLDLARRFELRRTSHNTPEEIAPDLAWADAVIMWSWPRLDHALLDRAGSLLYVGHIDVCQTAARCELERGIRVSTSRGGWSPAVSEMALGLILSALRRISDYHASMRQGNEKWVSAFPKDIDPLERHLSGQTVGIVGFGRVGRRLAELLRPFQVDLLVVDPFVPESALEPFSAKRVTMDAMVDACEVVVLSAASNEGTRHLLDADRIARLRPHSVLVNVARANLIDTEALIRRLRQGDMQASLDVFDREPLEAESVLRQLPNCYLTPHRAGGLIASVQRTVDWLIEDLHLVLAGQAQRYPLRPEMIPALDA